MGAARRGTRGSETVGEGTRAHLAPVLLCEVISPSLASPFSSVQWGWQRQRLAGWGGAIIGERGRSWWKKSGWMGKVGKARIKRVETVGGVWWVGQGGAESLGEEKSSDEVAEAGGPGWGVRAEKADKASQARLDW